MANIRIYSMCKDTSAFTKHEEIECSPGVGKPAFHRND